MLNKLRQIFMKGYEFNAQNSAVIVIDMQPRMLEKLVIEDLNSQLKSQKEVLEICAKKDIPVLALESEGYGKTREDLISYVTSVPRVAYFQKPEDNGFERTLLSEKLKSWGVENVFLMGVNADTCVLETGKGARKSKLEAFTSTDVIKTTHNVRPAKYVTRFYKLGIPVEKHYSDFKIFKGENQDD